VVFDKDNVLTAPYAKELHISVQVWHGAALLIISSHTWANCTAQPGWERCRRVFGEDVYIMSNSAGSADDAPLYNEAGALEATLGARVIRHGIKKPGGGAELLAAAGHDPKHIAFVGDRLLTDVVFANTHGLLAIHTQPLTLVNDNYWAKQVWHCFKVTWCVPHAQRASW
jgi:phosphatidylglycerophosphatase GEP4